MNEEGRRLKRQQIIDRNYEKKALYQKIETIVCIIIVIAIFLYCGYDEGKDLDAGDYTVGYNNEVVIDMSINS